MAAPSPATPAAPVAPVSFEDTRIAFEAKSDADLRRMYLLFAAMNQGSLVQLGGGLMQSALQWGLPGTKVLIKHTIFRQFCGGETIAECQPVIAALGRYHIGTILDYSVEGADNDYSFDRTRDEILATIALAATTPHIPFSVFKVTGLLPTALLEKKQAGTALSASEEAAFARGGARLDALCASAHARGVRLFVDAEESWIQHSIDELAEAMMVRYNQERAIVWNTYQLYRHDRLDAFREAYERAAAGNYYLGVKLVRGAYMEKEARIAQQRSLPTPINPSKQHTDDLYDEALRFAVQHIDRISLCAGTHNEASSLLLTELMRAAGLAPRDERVWFAQLYGMSDNLSYNLAHAGYHTAKYVPYGPIDAVMPYLLRRANENTAIAGQSSREFSLIKKELRRRGNKS